MPFDDRVASLIPSLRAWQEHLHQNPELSFEEVETTAYLEQILSAMPGVSPAPQKQGLSQASGAKSPACLPCSACVGTSTRSPSTKRAASPMLHRARV